MMREGEKMKIRVQKGRVRITREGGREVRVAGIPGRQKASVVVRRHTNT